jgi:hypothetical protein
MSYEWTEDGHKLNFEIDGDEISISHVDCPMTGSSAFCNRRRNFCVVQRFVGIFGPECNIGQSRIQGPVEIAWIGVPGDSDLDDEFAQVWVTPINDPEYQSSKISIMGEL